jgi:tetratricopeptide (TPR) repeat protein
MTNSTPSVPADPKGLEAYFTDVEYLRDYFQRTVAAPTLDRRVLVIHGVGGIGKSSLLAMFRLHCKREHVPVALASGDKAKSIVDVLSDWSTDLKTDSVNLPSFAKTFQHYRAVQAKVEDQSRKIQDSLGKIAKGAVETAASVIPGLGPVVGKLGGIGAEAMIDWLRGFLSKPDIDLLLDPTQKLTEDFLKDVYNIAARRRLVLMLDTFEQMTALDDWVRDLAQKLHPNVLFVLAGRAMPDWKRAWPEWLAHAYVEELEPMSKRVMHELVRRYYATMRGGQPDPKQVDAIIEFARGLPIVVNSAVQLWVQYGVEDFQAVKSEVVADLVERLREGVPPEMYPALEAAAAVRWFDKELLGVILNGAEVSFVYDELRRFPFVRPRADGYALHDAVREILDENLRRHNRLQHRVLHQRAADFFDAKLQQRQRYSPEWERLNLERIYQWLCVDDSAGLTKFKEVFEEIQLYYPQGLDKLLIEFRRATIDPGNQELWRDWISYYAARFERNKQQLSRLAEHPELALYARTSLALALFREEQIEPAIVVLEKNLDYARTDKYLNLSAIDQYTARLSLRYLLTGYRVTGRLREVISLPQHENDARALMEIARCLWFLGRFQDAVNAYQRTLEILAASAAPTRYEVRARRHLGHVYEGQKRLVAARIQYENSRAKALAIGDDFQADLAKCNLAVFDCDRMTLSKIVEYLVQHRAEHKGEATTIIYYLVELGRLCFRSGEYPAALSLFQRAYSLSQQVRYQTGMLRSLLGICVSRYATGSMGAVEAPLAEIEQHAQRHEYNDYLAAVRHVQARLVWRDNYPGQVNGFEAALRFYQQALIHALRFNRFLLDEVLWEGAVTTLLQPIIPYCLERDEEGRQMLMALRDWWQTGINDIGAPRPDTISPIPEGVSLLEAERIARQREPGDGLPQVNVVDKIEAALADL